MSEQPYNNNHESEADAEAMLPFGMSGVTGLLERLQEGLKGGNWAPKKRKMVAKYLLDLSNRYWMSEHEMSFCRNLAEAG